jgi:hypothetical protein
VLDDLDHDAFGREHAPVLLNQRAACEVDERRAIAGERIEAERGGALLDIGGGRELGIHAGESVLGTVAEQQLVAHERRIPAGISWRAA